MDSSPDFGGESRQGDIDPSISPDQYTDVSVQVQPDRFHADSPPPSEVFQMLANEVRIRIIVELFQAERNERTPVPFSTLQAAIGSDESARFAYHVRQLVDHFIVKREGGYALTPAGRNAANSIIQGTFSNGNGGQRAS